MDSSQFMAEWARLKAEHAHDRDNMNNYGCFNVEGCRNCNYVYNSRNAINCANSDSLIECVQCVDTRDSAFCIGLNGARFHILNREVGEAEYYATLRALGIDWNVQAYDPLLDAFGEGGDAFFK